MTRLSKALLLSALIYPGAGQLFLKHYKTGASFMLIASIGLYFILDNTFKIASQIAEDITKGGVALDFTTLLNLVSQHDTQLLSNAVYLISLTWLISLIHTYFVGKQVD